MSLTYNESVTDRRTDGPSYSDARIYQVSSVHRLQHLQNIDLKLHLRTDRRTDRPSYGIKSLLREGEHAIKWSWTT